MNFKKFLGITVSLMLTGQTVFASTTPYGSSAAMQDKSLTVSSMLTYAIQDEYLARGEYAGIQATLGTGRPFSNIQTAENVHIALLANLFKSYKLDVPKDESSKFVAIPKTLTEAYAAGVSAEKTNIAMYDLFLKQSDLPADVKLVFERLKSSSQAHLAAFSKTTRGRGHW